MKKIILIILTSLLLFVQQTKVKAQAGTLDSTFGNAGLVTTFVASSFDNANCSAIQADGKILVAGYSSSDTAANNPCFAMVRYNNDGTLDSAFNSTGKVVTNISGSTRSVVYAMALQPDSKIILTGYAKIGSSNKFAIVRYLTNGNIDSTFGNNGLATSSIGSLDDRITSIVLQNDGKIAVGGVTKISPTVFNFAIARYDSIGVLDTTFSQDGINTTSFGGNAASNSIALQQDGTYYLFGSVVNISTLYMAMARYLPNGSLDSSFGTNGINTYAPGNGFNNSGAKVLIQPDKKILLYGNADFSGISKMVVMRLDSTCTILDNTFGVGGTTSTGFSTNAYGAGDFVLQPDGKIVTAGRLLDNGNYDFALIRLNSNGIPDSTFGTNGKVTTSFNSNDDYPSSVNIQLDGKIVFAGTTTNPTTSVDNFALARYLGDISVGLSSNIDSPGELVIYPNPFANELNIKLNGNELNEISLYDMSSRQLLHRIFSNSLTINTDQLSNGIYLYSVRNKNGIVKNGKVIKQ